MQGFLCVYRHSQSAVRSKPQPEDLSESVGDDDCTDIKDKIECQHYSMTIKHENETEQRSQAHTRERGEPHNVSKVKLRSRHTENPKLTFLS